MSTTGPSHETTETDELAAALEEASVRWPGFSRDDLIARLALEGNHAAMAGLRDRSEARLRAIRRHAGALTDAYGPDALTDLRRDWPE